MKKNILWMLAAILVCGLTVTALSACSSGGSDDDTPSGNTPEVPVPETPVVEKLDSTILSLTYHNFITPDDVTILNSDTTKLSVSKALIDKMGATQLKGRRLAVWQKVSKLPFYRGIVSAQLSGDRYLLDVKPIKIEEFLKGVSIKYKNDLYYNSAAATTRSITRSDGTRSEVVDLSARYTDPEGYVHPAAVLYTDLDMKGKSYAYVPTGYDDPDDPVYTDGQHTRSMITRAASDFDGDYGYVTPEQGGNFSVDLINISIDLEKKMTLGVGSNPATVRFKMPMKIKTNLWGRIEYDIFGLEFFGVSLCGSMEFSPEVKFSGSQMPKGFRRIQVLDFPANTYVLLVSFLPITIGLRPALFLCPDFTFNSDAEFGFSYNWKGSYDAGVYWDEDDGFGLYHTGQESGKGFQFIPPKADGKLRASFGFALGGDVEIYFVAGPTIYLGPKVELECNMKNGGSVDTASADYSLTSDVGFKLSAFGVSLAQWETSFTCLGPYNIWKYPN